MEQKHVLRVSVRNLVEFILRSGDIEGPSGGFRDKEAMQAGSRIHRKLQGRMGIEYQAEYVLKELLDWDRYVLSLEGRADGIWTRDGHVTVDEIKGIYMDLARLEEPKAMHLAQARCYAWIYAKQEGLEEISIRMTYANLDTEELKYFYEETTYEELNAWMQPILKEYRKWTDFAYDWKLKRQASIAEVTFPYSYRAGQKELAEGVYRTIVHKRRLFVQAPTGIGKTLSAVFPAVKAVGAEKADKIFYLTAKTVTRGVALDTFQILRKQGLAYKVIALTAKEKSCACEEMHCDPVHCPRAKGHFDRVNEAIFTLLQEQDVYSREIIAAYAERFQVCPFEFALDVSLWCDAIIGDYNYVFDPRVSLKRFFADGVSGSYLFLVDEAHNLVSRAREMYSAVLCKEDMLELARLVEPFHKPLHRVLKRCNQQMLEFKRACDQGLQVVDGIGTLSFLLLNLASELENYLEQLFPGDLREKVLEFYFAVRTFLNVYDLLDENYIIYTELEASQRFYLHLYCVNPANNLGTVMMKGVSTIFFSATLLPLPYYQGLLSERTDDFAMYVDSPFDRRHRKILLANDVSSKYTRRNRQEYEKIASYIRKAMAARPGKYLAFFPSYQFMEEVATCLEEMPHMIKQTMHMDEQERERFLNAFEEPWGKEQSGCSSLLGLCVMGGVFSEGIDLKGESLIGVIVVGTGLAQIDHKNDLLKQYYQEHGKDGFAYAYRIPGMNKVLQAAGRVIRTMDDKGVILLLDDRFLHREYLEMFPREWTDYEVCNLQNVDGKLEAFWRTYEGDG